MGELRRVVPDASVMLPAFFQESIAYRGGSFDLTRRAKPLADAIRTHGVSAYAPDRLVCEFVANAQEKISVRTRYPEWDLQTVEERVLDFLCLPITYQPAEEIAMVAWDLMLNRHIPPPDSWYLACAIYFDAELWLSQEHRDGLADTARAIHRRVHLLTEDKFI